MLQHTTLDDFLRGMYVKAVDSTPKGSHQTQHDKLLSQLMNTREDGDSAEDGRTGKRTGPQLLFEDSQLEGVKSALGERSIDMFRGDNLRRQALQNLKERR